MSKTRRPKSRPVKQNETDTSRGFDLESWVAKRWVAALFFLVIAVVYFSGFVFTENVIYGPDTGTDFHGGKGSFTEELQEITPPNWFTLLGGMPASAGPRRQYFPAHVLSFLMSNHRYFSWRYLFAMFCSGFFTYLFVSALGLHPFTALIAGLGFACAPTVLSFTFAGHYAKMSAISFFPLQAWALFRGLRTRRVYHFLILAAGIALAVYSPHIQIVYFSLWALGFLFVYKVVVQYLDERDLTRAAYRSALAAGAVALGVAIGAEGIFPQWYAAKYSKRGVHQDEAAAVAFSASWSLHPEDIASLVVPEFVHWGPNYWGQNPGKWNSDYPGIVILFFAAIALGRVRGDWRIRLFLSLAVLITFFALGTHTPLYGLFYEIVPGVRDIRTVGMIAFLIAFCLCALAAFGLDALMKDGPRHPAFLRRLFIGAGITVGVLLLASLAPESVIRLFTGLCWSDIPPEKFRIALVNAPHLARGALLGAALVAVLSGMCWARLIGRLGAAGFMALLIPLILFDTWRVDKQLLTYLNPNLYSPRDLINADAVRFLKQDESLYRVLALPDDQKVQLPGVTLVTGFSDFTLPRYDHLLRSGLYGLPPILNLINTKYIVSQPPLQDGWIVPAAVKDRLHIFRNPGSLPWFYLASEYVIFQEEERIIELLKNPEFNPRRTVILEESPAGIDAIERGAPGEVETLEYNPRAGRIHLRVRAPAPRLLVISENHHPYWHAYVGGKEQPLFQANYLWKALIVPVGDQSVELVYRDPVTSLSRWVTLSALLLMAVGLALSRRLQAGERARG